MIKGPSLWKVPSEILKWVRERALSHLVAVLIRLRNRKREREREGSQDNLWDLGGEISHRNDSRGSHWAGAAESESGH